MACPSRELTHDLQEAYKIFTVDKVIGSIVKQVREIVHPPSMASLG